MAGLYNLWRPSGPMGRPIPTFTVVTITPNQWMARIHDRMPAILQDDEVETWLNPSVSDPERLMDLLKAPPEQFLECYPVERNLLNSGLVDAPECTENTGMDYALLLRTGVG
jgi:putative SOS response-associated peptidase YedK